MDNTNVKRLSLQVNLDDFIPATEEEKAHRGLYAPSGPVQALLQARQRVDAGERSELRGREVGAASGKVQIGS